MTLSRFRVAERVFRVIAYLLIISSGTFALLAPPTSYGAFSDVLTNCWAWGQLVFGLAALVGLLARKPVIENMVVGILAACVMLYAALGWFQVFTEVPAHGARASDISALVALLAARYFFLGGQRKAIDEEAVARTVAREARA